MTSKTQLEEDRRRNAILAAFATTLGLGGVQGAKNAKFDNDELSLKATRDFADFKKKMQPGDLVFQRSNYENKGLKKLKWQRDAINAIKGDTLYHPALVTKPGYMLQASGFGTDVKNTKFVTSDDYPAEWRVYRSKDPRQIEKSLEYAKRIAENKVPYSAPTDVVKHGLKHLAGITVPTGKQKFCKGAVCSSAIAETYPKYFRDQLATTMSMRSNPNLELIARYNPIGKISMREKLLAYGLNPLLKNAKYGLLAGAGLYAGSKINEALREG